MQGENKHSKNMHSKNMHSKNIQNEITLSDADKNELMERFPTIELCYESNIEHNKVSAKADYYSLIPKGKKVLIWTTYYKHHHMISFVLELNRGEIENIRHVAIPIEKEHAYGTIFYGTSFNKNYFSIENIHYYKGRNTERHTSQEQLGICKEYLDIVYCEKNKGQKWSFKMGIPYMSTDMDECMRMNNLIPYRGYSIQHKKYSWNNKKIHFSFIKNTVPLNNNSGIYMTVVADTQNDVYHAYCIGDENPYAVLYIPDIKTSKMMNKLYRNIKENDNLDALEESDDDEDFENVDEDKYVLKNRKHIIECAFNAKFRKWYPVRLSKNKSCETNRNEIKKIEASGYVGQGMGQTQRQGIGQKQSQCIGQKQSQGIGQKQSQGIGQKQSMGQGRGAYNVGFKQNAQSNMRYKKI